MEMGKYNAFSDQPIYVPSPRYLTLVETLLNRKLEPEDNAPLPVITLHNVDEPIKPLPGDFTRTVEEEIRAKVHLALGSLPSDWEILGEDERVPWLAEAHHGLPSGLQPSGQEHPQYKHHADRQQPGEEKIGDEAGANTLEGDLGRFKLIDQLRVGLHSHRAE